MYMQIITYLVIYDYGTNIMEHCTCICENMIRFHITYCWQTGRNIGNVFDFMPTVDCSVKTSEFEHSLKLSVILQKQNTKLCEII